MSTVNSKLVLQVFPRNNEINVSEILKFTWGQWSY